MRKLPTSKQEIFKFFLGKWNFTRKVTDWMEPGYYIDVKGTARFYDFPVEIDKNHRVKMGENTTNSLLYCEDIKFMLDGKPTTGTQSYIFRLGNNIEQYCFTDCSSKALESIKKGTSQQRIEKMYELEFEHHKNSLQQDVLIASGRYNCGNDTYDAYYTIESFEEFSLNFYTKGPYKKYTIKTWFSKIDEADDITVAGDLGYGNGMEQGS